MDMLDEMILKGFLGYNKSIIHCTSNNNDIGRKQSYKAYFGIILFTCFLTLLVNKSTGKNDHRPSCFLTNKWSDSFTLLNTGADHAKFLLNIVGFFLKIFLRTFIILLIVKKNHYQ